MARQNFIAVLYTMTAGYVCSAFANECTLPKPEPIDWNKMSGNWYEIANDGSGFSKASGRMVLHDIRRVADGVELLIDDQNIKNGGKTVTYHWVLTRPGVFVDDLDSKQNLIAKLKGRSEDDRFVSVAQEVKSWREETPVTNYEQYFVGFQCGAGGEKYVYIHHRNPNPTAADIFQVWRKIIEIGGGWEKVPLYSIDEEST